MDELPQVDVLGLTEIHDCEEALSDDAGEGAVSEQGYFVDALGLIVRLGGEVLEDVLEVRDCHVLLELFVVENLVVDKLDLVWHCLVHTFLC